MNVMTPNISTAGFTDARAQSGLHDRGASSPPSARPHFKYITRRIGLRLSELLTWRHELRGSPAAKGGQPVTICRRPTGRVLFGNHSSIDFGGGAGIYLDIMQSHIRRRQRPLICSAQPRL